MNSKNDDKSGKTLNFKKDLKIAKKCQKRSLRSCTVSNLKTHEKNDAQKNVVSVEKKKQDCKTDLNLHNAFLQTGLKHSENDGKKETEKEKDKIEIYDYIDIEENIISVENESDEGHQMSISVAEAVSVSLDQWMDWK